MSRKRKTRTEEPEKVYVEHPRWGSRPRPTGLSVSFQPPEFIPHWLATFPQPGLRVIPGTAIAADVARQTPATVQVTHYSDLERTCRDCGRLFLFFAVEQKHWYEELGFPLEADCVRCHPCRRRTRELRALHERYQALLSQADPSPDEEAELALVRVELLEAAFFGAKQIDAVRAFLRRHSGHPRAAEVRERLARLAER
jgi:hypothetical protein